MTPAGCRHLMLPLRNTATRYGAVTKSLHWLLVLLLLNQFVVAAAMLNMADDETTAGFSQGGLYEWHKSIGLVALGVVIVRYVWRRLTPLPDWAPGLADGEKRAIHVIERVLYVGMFVMPISGFLFVMAGGFGVLLFNQWRLPNIIGRHPLLATVAQATHAFAAMALLVAIVAHWVFVLRRQLIYKDRYIHRMLPFVNQR